MGNLSQSSKRRAEKEFDVYFNHEQKQNKMKTEYRIITKIIDKPTRSIYQSQQLIIKRKMFKKSKSWLPITGKWWSSAYGAELEIKTKRL